MQLGDTQTLTRTFSRDDVGAYTALGGAAPQGDRVPEPMIAALFSCLLGVRLPGPGTNYLKQSLKFHHGAKVDSPLTARVTITRIREEKALVDLETVCKNADGKEICSGRALVRVKDVGA